ncbi:MAG: RNase adapter RapZ [Mycoplasmatales bacterium]
MKEVILTTGVSGSGRTTIMQVLMDNGYFILDNISAKSLKMIMDTIMQTEDIKKIALILKAGDKPLLDEGLTVIRKLERAGLINVKRLVITANLQTIVNRYQEHRKIHPMVAEDSSLTLIDAIEVELENIAEFSRYADHVIDTSDLLINDTKNIILAWLNSENKFTINLRSFGFKYGVPVDSDFVCDVRFLKNPFYILELRSLSGLDDAVYNYVFSTELANEYYEQLTKMLILTINGYIEEGRMLTNISIGCTGGQHRSVAFVERLKKELPFEKINVIHIENEKGTW